MTEGSRYGYWSDHKYTRRTIKHSFLKFCGWNVLEDTLNKIDPINAPLVCALFETGGRAEEVLTLRPEQFVVEDDYVLVMRMSVLKQREKVYTRTKSGEYILDKKGQRKFTWRRREVDRTFPISRSDPLMPPLLSYIKTVKEGDRLFKYKYDKLYKIVRDIQKPEDAKHGPWWPHRFRAERATQLVVEKGFDVLGLMEWFGWKRTDTPVNYAKLNPKDLIKKVLRGEP